MLTNGRRDGEKVTAEEYVSVQACRRPANVFCFPLRAVSSLAVQSLLEIHPRRDFLFSKYKTR